MDKKDYTEILYKLAKESEEENVDNLYTKYKNAYESLVINKNIDFQFYMFKIEDVCKLIKEIVELRNLDKVDFLKREKEFIAPNLKIIENLNKEDMDIDLDFLVCHFVNKGKLFDSIHLNYKIPHQQYENELKSEIMKKVRYFDDTNKEKLKYCYDIVESYWNQTNYEFGGKKDNVIRNLFIECKIISIIDSTFLFGIIQNIMYSIVANEQIEKSIKIEALTDIHEMIGEETKKILGDKVFSKENIFNAFAIYLSRTNKRNENKNYIDIIELLDEEVIDNEIFYPVQGKYKSNKRYISNMDIEEMRDLIYEGKYIGIRKSRFKNDLEEAQQLIKILYKYANRQLHPEYLQHIRAVYREIHLSKVKYNDRMASTITREWVGKLESEEEYNFNSKKDTFFIREKISRGLFREKNLLEEHIIKNEIHKTILECIVYIYNTCDIVIIRKKILELFRGINSNMLKIYDKYNL
jgi:uncharacterized protein YfkK (UPF0435 family)